MLNGISKTEKDKYFMISHICGIFKTRKNKNPEAHRYKEQIGGCQRQGKGEVREGQGKWVKLVKSINFQLQNKSQGRS